VRHAFETWQRSAKKREARFAPNDAMSPTMKLEKGVNRGQGLLRCRDLGMNCPKEIRAQTEEELFKLAAEHAEKDHGFPAFMIPRTIMAMVRASIRDE
jgi:predicted small metal-binding protein